jgi:hypothetical protein
MALHGRTPGRVPVCLRLGRDAAKHLQQGF